MNHFLDEFTELLTDTVLAKPGALDAFGDWVASGAVLSLPCRIEGTIQLTRDRGGRETVSSVQIILAPSGLTTHLHRYTIPDRFAPNVDIQALSIERETDEDGPVYDVIYLP